jgi:spermidine synthase
MSVKYSKDICGNNILIDDSENHQIMMEWEKPYMEKSIKILNPFGKVLEIGFGMGYSATEICKNTNVTEYSVIECKPIVWKNFDKWKKEQKKNLKINLIKGRWQDILETLDKFDCIYFDDYDMETNNNPNIRFNKFVYNILKNHLNIGSKFSCYSTANHNTLSHLIIPYKLFKI